MDERAKRNYKMMAPKLRRTCLSAQSALSGKPNIEDVPLGAKLPLIPGSCIVLSTVNLGEKLHQPSCDFDRTYPSDVYISNEYRCLHDPHLRHYFAQKSDVTKRLKRRRYITPENKVVCSLKEYNLYRQYLKHLSIEYFNKILREGYEKELEIKREETVANIEKKQQDPNNPITKRINRATKARNAMERALTQKRKKVIRNAEEERVERCRRKEEEMRRRIEDEVARERKREKYKKIKMMKFEEERLLKEELLFYKHQEEIYRSKELEERKKAIAIERQRKLTEKYERKKRFHLMKMAELNQLLNEKEEERQKNVEFWKKFFENKLNQQRHKLRLIMAKQARLREEKNKRIEESLRARGWREVKGKFPEQLKDEIKTEKRSTKKKVKRSKPWKPHQLSALGFHNAIVSEDLLDLIWDEDVTDSPSSDDGEENSAGDAIINPLLKTLSQQAKIICDDVITSERARHLVTEVVDLSQKMEKTSTELVKQAIEISQEVMLPMLRMYEQRTGVKIPDSKVLSTLHDLCNDILDEETDDLPSLVNISQPGQATIKAGTKDSAVRFVVSNTDLPGGHRNRQQRPPTPIRRVKFYESMGDLSELVESDSQVILGETIKTLASKVVDQVFKTADLPLPRTVLQERVSDLANSVVNEIITIEEATETHMEFVDFEAISSTSSEHSEETLDRKISLLAKALVTQSFDEETSSEVQKIVNSLSAETLKSDDTMAQSDVSLLALQVVQSAFKTLDPAAEINEENSQRLCEQLEPFINELSSKLVEEIIIGRQTEAGEIFLPDEVVHVEEKISKLALNIVGSVLKGSAASASTSLSSISSVTREAKIGEITVDTITSIMKLKKLLPPDLSVVNRDTTKQSPAAAAIGEILNLKALHETPKKVLTSLEENDIRRIGTEITKTLVPSRCASSVFSSGINELAIALTENAVRNAAKSSSSDQSSSSPSLDKAIKGLADTLVKETLHKSSLLSSGTQSAISSGLDLLADDITNEVIHRVEQISEESAVSSGASKLADDLITSALEKGNKVGSSTESAVLSGVDILASTLFQETIRSATGVGSSSESTLNSAIKDLSENVANMALDEALGKCNNAGSSAESAISSLATYVTKCTVGKEGTTSSDVESALSSGVSKIIVDTLSTRVMEIIQEKKNSQLKTVDKDKLKGDIIRIVRSLIDAYNSSMSDTQQEDQTKTSDDKITNVISSLTSSGSSAVSTAISALANDILGNCIATQNTSAADKKDFSPRHHDQSLEQSEGQETQKIATSKSHTHRTPYESNFTWRSPQSKDSHSTKDTRAIKVYATQLNLNKMAEGKKATFSHHVMPVLTEQSSAEMQEALDELATRIVKSVVLNNNDSTDTSEDVVYLSKSQSVEKLVESLALGVVTSLLGLDVSISDETLVQDSTISNTSPLDEKSDKMDEVIPTPSSGYFTRNKGLFDTRTKLANLPRPSAPIPGRRRHAVKESGMFEALPTFLNQPFDATKKECVDQCEDIALNHPHRIPSPKASRRSTYESKERHQQRCNLFV